MALQNYTDTAVLPRQRARREPGTGAPAATAQAISHILSPPVLTTACVFAAAVGDGRPTAFLAATAFTVMGAVLPLLAVLRQFKAGQISDLELTRRDQRHWPMLVTTTCVGLGAGLLQLSGAPTAVAGMASILGVVSLCLLAVTTRWKISVHCAAASAAAAVLWSLTGLLAPGLSLVIAMIWSRLYLRRHTPLQCLAGTIVGAGIMLLFWPLLG